MDASGVYQTLAESWDGASWSIVPSPNEGAGDNELRSISCTATNNCVAVGWYVDALGQDQTLSEVWNGSAWSIVPSPNTAVNDYLTSVSCYSGGCAAVGYDVNASNLDQTLIETYNSSAWTLTPSPDQGALKNELIGVTCLEVGTCTAVGEYTDGAASDTEEALVESFDASSWAIVPTPVGLPGDDYELDSISCANASSCYAVGQTAALIEYWDGSSWSVAQYGGGAELNGVFCETPSNCIAVGSQGGFQSLVEFSDGYGWLRAASQNEGPDNWLASVACMSLTNCVAVGNYNPPSNAPMQTLGEIGPIPPPPAPAISRLNPSHGPPGTGVVISGTNLIAASAVTFHGVAAKIITDTAYKIEVKVPSGATSGYVKVTVPGGTAKSSSEFVVTKGRT
jgi:hypothetical protein